jgi:hypothetical protein
VGTRRRATPANTLKSRPNSSAFTTDRKLGSWSEAELTVWLQRS